MDSNILYRLLALFVLFNLSAFFSGSETAFFSLDSLTLKKLKEEETVTASLILRLISQKEKLLTTILLGNEIVNVAISSVSASLFITLFGENWVGLSVFVTTFFILLYGEVLPKIVAVKHNLLWARLAVLPLSGLMILLLPLRVVLEGISKITGSVVGKEKPDLREEDFKTLVREAYDEGVLEDKEKDMIYKVFRFTELTVSEIMVPEPDIFMIPADIDLEKLFELLQKEENRHSKIPVFEGSRDNIIGYVHISDLMSIFKGLNRKSLKDILYDCLFVPETKPVQEMLREFQARKKEIAIVVNEYGGVEGLVTLEDVLEEIVGEISDEFDREKILVRRISDREFILDASLPLREAADLLGIKPEENLDVGTLGGYILHLFGSVPSVGDSIEKNGWIFTVKKMDPRRHRILTIEAKKKDEVSGNKNNGKNRGDRLSA